MLQHRLTLLFAAALTTFVIAGCMQMAAQSMSTGQPTVQDDNYSQVATVTTAKYEITTGADVMLRGIIAKSAEIDTTELDSTAAAALDDVSEPAYQLYFSMTGQDWHYWDEARFRTGGELHTVQLGRIASDVRCTSYGCTHYEDVAGDIPRSKLETIAETGGDSLRVYSGQYADTWKAVYLPADEVRSFLGKVDSLTAQYSR